MPPASPLPPLLTPPARPSTLAPRSALRRRAPSEYAAWAAALPYLYRITRLVPCAREWQAFLGGALLDAFLKQARIRTAAPCPAAALPKPQSPLSPPTHRLCRHLFEALCCLHRVQGGGGGTTPSEGEQTAGLVFSFQLNASSVPADKQARGGAEPQRSCLCTPTTPRTPTRADSRPPTHPHPLIVAPAGRGLPTAAPRAAASGWLLWQRAGAGARARAHAAIRWVGRAGGRVGGWVGGVFGGWVGGMVCGGRMQAACSQAACPRARLPALPHHHKLTLPACLHPCPAAGYLKGSGRASQAEALLDPDVRAAVYETAAHAGGGQGDAYEQLRAQYGGAATPDEKQRALLALGYAGGDKGALQGRTLEFALSDAVRAQVRALWRDPRGFACCVRLRAGDRVPGRPPAPPPPPPDSPPTQN